MARIIRIRCTKCGEVVFRYQKMGKGRVWRCWRSRIVQDFSVREGDEVRCPRCGNLIGTDKGLFVKMRQSSFRVTS